MGESHEAQQERREAEERGKNLEPDLTDEAALSGDLSDEPPEDRDKREPPPLTQPASEDD